MFNMIKKADIVLFVLLIAFGLALSFFSMGTSGQRAVITVDGKPYGTYSLAENQTIEIEQNHHINKITINNGTVQMSYSTCKNQVCVKDGTISRTNQSLVCLPNRVMVEIQGGEEEFDAVAN